MHETVLTVEQVKENIKNFNNSLDTVTKEDYYTLIKQISRLTLDNYSKNLLFQEATKNYDLYK